MKIDYRDKSLVGSSLFFSSNSLVGFVVKLGGFFDKINGFKMNKWSHVGTIVMKNDGKLGLIEALEPIVVINDLQERIESCKDKMELCILKPHLRQLVKDNIEHFNKMVNEFVGEKYNKLGAVISGIDIIKDESKVSKWFSKKRHVLHCSYLDGMLKKSCGVLPADTNCKELTPQDNYQEDIYNIKVGL